MKTMTDKEIKRLVQMNDINIMNDFTKEELEELIMWSLHLAGCNHNLVNKIQFMIDNYCEHDFNPIIGFFQIESCHKCMKVK